MYVPDKSRTIHVTDKAGTDSPSLELFMPLNNIWETYYIYVLSPTKSLHCVSVTPQVMTYLEVTTKNIKLH